MKKLNFNIETLKQGKTIEYETTGIYIYKNHLYKPCEYIPSNNNIIIANFEKIIQLISKGNIRLITFLGRYETNLEHIHQLLQNIKGIVPPQSKITYKHLCVGYTQKYLQDFEQLNDSTNTLSYSSKKIILLKLIKTVKTLHKKGIIHTDLSTRNILCNQHQVYIIDCDDIIDQNHSNEQSYKKELNYEIENLIQIVLQILFPNFKIYQTENTNIPTEIKEYLETPQNKNITYPDQLLSTLPEYHYDPIKKLFLN